MPQPRATNPSCHQNSRSHVTSKQKKVTFKTARGKTHTQKRQPSPSLPVGLYHTLTLSLYKPPNNTAPYKNSPPASPSHIRPSTFTLTAGGYRIQFLKSPQSMVISPESPPPPPDQMAAAPARAESQSNLHNFSFPVLKKWGSQRVLRCVKVDRNGEVIRSPPTPPPPISRSAPVAREGDEYEPLEKESPWNLRTRRGQVKDQGVPREERGSHVRTVRLRSEDAERRERPRFSVSLTREEIDEDVYALTGGRARRRPKKRPRSVQKQLDMLSPGSWLSEITVDSYKVPDSWLERR